MADPDGFLLRFAMDKGPTTYHRQVALYATLFPLCGPARGHEAQAAKALELVRRWRARVALLHHQGWDMTQPRVRRDGRPAGSRKWRMLNCPPAAILATPRARTCNNAMICPHCWARAAASQWAAIDRRIFGPPRPRASIPRTMNARPALAVVRRYRSVPVTGADGLAAALAQYLAAAPAAPRRADWAGLRRAGCTGGLETLVLVPARTMAEREPEGRRGPVAWFLQVRQVLVVPTPGLAAFLADPAVAAPQATLAATPGPTRRLLARAVADACRYPSYLLYGHSRHTFAALAARRGRRLTSRFGRLYGPPATGGFAPDPAETA